MKRLLLATLHMCLLAIFLLAALFFLGMAGGGHTPFSSFDSYNTGAYIWGLLLFVFPPLLLLGVLFLLLVPSSGKWLPLLGLLGLVGQVPLFNPIYLLLSNELLQSVPFTIGFAIAIVGCCATIRQGVQLYTNGTSQPQR